MQELRYEGEVQENAVEVKVLRRVPVSREFLRQERVWSILATETSQCEVNTGGTGMWGAGPLGGHWSSLSQPEESLQKILGRSWERER